MSTVTTTIDGVQLKLSNLDKVLYPESGITKAELIQYYLSVYAYMAPHLVGRPCTLIRFPDGINGTKFYSKNAADYTPEWLPTTMHSDIKYLYVQKSADLVYMANLASLELHTMTVKMPNIDKPDTIIFDLDPSEDIHFDEIKSIANDLYYFLKNIGYHPFVKTSGSKGIHLYVPIQPLYDRPTIFNTAKDLGQQFVELNKSTTLKISKEKRVGKTLIDIYRNHSSQTCVVALSTRAKPGAPVSMPLLFEDLKNLTSAQDYNIKNALAYLTDKNPWHNFKASGVEVISKNTAVAVNKMDAVSEQDQAVKLAMYEQKRNFENTPEPPSTTSDAYIPSNRFVLQMHDASNLHYDLRLEENGVLSSWAIPKGLPSALEVKRLAIRTEDHPLKYLTFEGEIPKNEYGGGSMWVFDTGTYELIKKEEKSYKFVLKGKRFSGEYSLYNTKENQWIIELKSKAWAVDPSQMASPMLAEQYGNQIPPSSQYLFELKWDGIRITAIKKVEKITLLSRSGRDITAWFPEIVHKLKDIDVEHAVVDGELVSLDLKGAPVFANIISRMHTKGSASIDIATKTNPAVFYIFDLRSQDGFNCENIPFEKRRAWLEAIVRKSDTIRISDIFQDGDSLFEGAKALGLEGIIAKRKGSMYTAGKRSADWIKVKVRTMIDVCIIGYTKGKGDRVEVFGSLHVAQIADGLIKYLGKVGTGFDERKINEIYQMLITKENIAKPITDVVEEEYNTVWIKDGPICEVQYASLTPNGTLREPVFHRFKELDE
jgi:bifunctional non-homologous end joining protein LigD